MINIKFFHSLEELLKKEGELLFQLGAPSSSNFSDTLSLWNAAVQKLSPSRGDAVALSLPLSADWFCAATALILRGAQPLFLPPSLDERELESWIRLSGAKFGIFQKLPFKGAQQLISSAIQIEGEETLPNWFLLSELKSDQYPPLRFPPDEELFQQKAVALTLSDGEFSPPELISVSPEHFANTLDSFRLWWESERNRPAALAIYLPPTLGTWTLISAAILHQIPVVLLTAPPTWDDLHSLASRHPQAVVVATNDVIWKLKSALQRDMESPPLRAIISVGGLLPDEMMPNLPLGRVLWAEEWGGLLSWNGGDNGESWGLLAPNVEFQVLRQQKIYRPGQTSFGRILLRGPRYSPQVLTSKGDWQLRIPESDGWVETPYWGDVKGDRKLWLEGLFDELIHYKEQRFSLWKAELYLMFHPDIAAAAVRPVPDTDNTVSKAYVELRPPTGLRKQITIRAVSQYLQEHLPHYLCPRYVEFCDQLPRNWFGKIARWKLK